MPKNVNEFLGNIGSFCRHVFLKQHVHSWGDVLLTAYLSIYVLPSYLPPWRLRVKQFSFTKPDDSVRDEETMHWGVLLCLQNCKTKFIWILTVNDRFAWSLYGSSCCPIYTWSILHRKSKIMECQNLGDLRFSGGRNTSTFHLKTFHLTSLLPRLPPSFKGAPSPTGQVAAPFSFLTSPYLHIFHRAGYSALKMEAENSSETSVSLQDYTAAQYYSYQRVRRDQVTLGYLHTSILHHALHTIKRNWRNITKLWTWT
jgi:hypothetical protein